MHYITTFIKLSILTIYYTNHFCFVKINDISIIKNNEEQKENLVLILLLFVLLDSYIYQKIIRKESTVSKLFPVFAGLITGIAILIQGGVYEGVSFISILRNLFQKNITELQNRLFSVTVGP